MAHICRLYELSNLLLRFSNLLGFTAAFLYDGAKFKLEKRGWTLRNSYATLLKVYNILAVIGYIWLRLELELKNYIRNTLAPGTSRAFDPYDVACDMLGALVYIAICIKFHAYRHRVLHTFNETLKIVQKTQQIAHKHFNCPRMALVLAYLLLVQSVLRQLWIFFQHPAPTADESVWHHWTTSFLLLFCDIFLKMHLIVYFLHFVLQSRCYYALNKFLECRMSERHLKTLQNLLRLQPRIQRLHCDVVRFFAFYLGWLQLCVFNSLYRLIVCFKYDDIALASQRGQLDADDGSVVENAETLPLYGYGSKTVLAWLALMWSVGQVLLLLYTAWVFSREKSLFKMYLLDLANYPEYFEQLHVNGIIQSHDNTVDNENTNRIAECILKYNIYDLMLEANMNLVEFADQNVVTLRAFRMKLPLRSLIWKFTLLASCGLLMFIEDVRQQQELRILEMLSKQ